MLSSEFYLPIWVTIPPLLGCHLLVFLLGRDMHETLDFWWRLRQAMDDASLRSGIDAARAVKEKYLHKRREYRRQGWFLW